MFLVWPGAMGGWHHILCNCCIYAWHLFARIYHWQTFLTVLLLSCPKMIFVITWWNRGGSGIVTIVIRDVVIRTFKWTLSPGTAVFNILIILWTFLHQYIGVLRLLTGSIHRRSTMPQHRGRVIIKLRCGLKGRSHVIVLLLISEIEAKKSILRGIIAVDVGILTHFRIRLLFWC
jgi:hypothetical protein